MRVEKGREILMDRGQDESERHEEFRGQVCVKTLAMDPPIIQFFSFECELR